jgi:tRNA (cmo5U34)-methyltransferase
MSERDTLFAGDGVGTEIPGFAFDSAVASVFPDMIRRSVPGYADLVGLTGIAAAAFARTGSRCYDLGCSRGASTFAVADAAYSAGVSDFEVVAVDSAPAMIERLKGSLDAWTRGKRGVRVTPLLSDVMDVGITDASVVVANYTLQFVSKSRRLELVERIFDGLLPGGALILSEKIVFASPAEEALASGLHEAFKKANGYSELEIARKRSALENVLVPETAEEHLRRLEDVGFQTVWRWFQSLNFVSWIAVKE